MKTRIETLRYKAVAACLPYRNAEAALLRFLREKKDATCYVSLSCGKDSSVVAHAAHAVMPGIPMLMVDPGCPTHWLERERDAWLRYAESHGWNLRLFPWDKWGCVDGETDMQKATDSIHKSMFSALHAYARRNGLTTRIMGMRADESRGRKITVRNLGLDYADINGERRLLPIGKWTTDFVWAYIVKHNIPWLEIYDYCGPDARNGLIGVHGTNEGRMVYLKRHFPEAWKVAQQVLSAADTAIH